MAKPRWLFKLRAKHKTKPLEAKDLNRVKGLDSLRFFLALIVMLSHLPNPYVAYFKSFNFIGLKYLGIIINHFICGTGAVIAFFVISGYVIHHQFVNATRIPAKHFLIRRWIRISGPMLVIILVSKHYGIYQQMPIWSLYCELAYYTLYPILFSIKATWKIKFYVSFALAAIIAILFNQQNIASFLHQTNVNYHGTYACNGILITWAIGLPCWLLGVLLAENLNKSQKGITKSLVWKWRIIIFLSSILFFVLRTHFFLSFVLSLNFFAILCYIWIKHEILFYRQLPSLALFEKLGTYSYSLFICHKLFFIILALFLKLNNSTYMVYLLFAASMSYLFYWGIEYPSHTLARKFGKFKNY